MDGFILPADGRLGGGAVARYTVRNTLGLEGFHLLSNESEAKLCQGNVDNEGAYGSALGIDFT